MEWLTFNTLQSALLNKPGFDRCGFNDADDFQLLCQGLIIENALLKNRGDFDRRLSREGSAFFGYIKKKRSYNLDKYKFYYLFIIFSPDGATIAPGSMC